MITNNGGPAFPRPASEYTAQGTLPDGNEAVVDQEGMSLRDYFAAKALPEVMSLQPRPIDLPRAEEIARQAYLIAEAMLKASQS